MFSIFYSIYLSSWQSPRRQQLPETEKKGFLFRFFLLSFIINIAWCRLMGVRMNQLNIDVLYRYCICTYNLLFSLFSNMLVNFI